MRTTIQKLEQKVEKEAHVSRYIILYKFILGFVETLLGVGILLFGKKFIILYQEFKTAELLENPHDFLVSVTERFIPYIFDHRGFVIFILILLGLGKMIGSAGMYYKKWWGLDLLIGLTVILLPFDVVYFMIAPTLARFIFLLVNIFIALYLINFKPIEYMLEVKERLAKNR